MRKFMNYSLLTLLVMMSCVIISCGSDNGREGAGGSENNGDKRVSAISGVAQKGQFLKGSSITIYALDQNLNATGLSYPTQTTDDMGTFSVVNVKADFIDIKANGYYFNENEGKTSKSTINLQALAASGKKVNVNLLTTLAYNRIKHLVAGGSKFADAQTRAQIEVLTALGLGNSTASNFVDMNIAGSGDANGLLLAASLLIQQDRSVGDVSKLISDIAADLEEDGILSGELNEETHRYEHHISVDDVILGLIDFYGKNKVTNYSIPTFYKFLDSDRDGKMDGAKEYIFMNIDYAEASYYDPLDMNRGYNANGFTRTLHFLSTIPFNVKSDASWLKVEKNLIVENIYSINVVAQQNNGENRTAHVLFTDNTGKELAKYFYQQKAPEELVPQRILFGYNSRVMENLMPETIGVNGKSYSVTHANEEIQNLYLGYMGYENDKCSYVDVPYNDKAGNYQLYFPTNMISMPNGYGTFKITIPTTISSDVFPFVAQSDNNYYRYYNSNAHLSLVRFVTAAPAIYIDNINLYDHIFLSSESPLCGSAIYSIRKGEVEYSTPSSSQEIPADNDGKYRMTVRVQQHENVYSAIIPVLSYNVRVLVQCYDVSNNLVNERNYYSSYYEYSGTTR